MSELNARPEPEALLPQLEQEYALAPPRSAEFIRRGFNDHYRLSAAGETFIFRLYLNGKYYIGGEGDFRFELELLRFLSGRGVSVSHPVPRRDGDLLTRIETGAGTRCGALFTIAPGEVVREPSLEQCERLGSELGRLHTAADAFHPAHDRYHLDERYLLDKPMQHIARFLRLHGKAEALDPLLPLIDRLRERLMRLPRSLPGYGIIHGDPHRGNVHFSDAHPTFFDFDHGGHGWRADDLGVCGGGLTGAHRARFLAAYAEVRPLPDEERASIPLFRKLRVIWDKGDVLAMQRAWGEEMGEPYADQIVAALREAFAV